MEVESFSLAPLFQAVGQALELNQKELNQADTYNGNHGDHMVQIFRLASHAADEKVRTPPAEGMQHAACLLAKEKQNGSAQVYSLGLSCMAEQFRKYEITLNDLIYYVQGVLIEDGDKTYDKSSPLQSGKVLKALVSGLAAWGQETDEGSRKGSPLDMGSLFEFGMAYLQARQRGGSKIEVLADAAASVSPLRRVPHRYLSGKIAIQALLQAVQDSSSVLAG